MSKSAKMEDLLGLTPTAIKIKPDKTEVQILMQGGRTFRFFHFQDCCENVQLEDWLNWEQLIGHPILKAYKTSTQKNTIYGDSETWTFYTLGNHITTTVMRWLGESNGYYSEDVDLEKIDE